MTTVTTEDNIERYNSRVNPYLRSLGRLLEFGVEDHWFVSSKLLRSIIYDHLNDTDKAFFNKEDVHLRNEGVFLVKEDQKKASKIEWEFLFKYFRTVVEKYGAEELTKISRYA